MFNTYNIPKELIELEITETTALRDVKFISERLYEIKSLGMNIIPGEIEQTGKIK